MNISIVMPTYNEEKRIGKTLEAYINFFNNIKKKDKLNYRILIVINNTKDDTLGVIKKFQKNNPEIYYLDLVRGGKGYAVIEGFKEELKTKSKIIGFVDADLATQPEAFYYLIKNIGRNDGAIANRYSNLSKITPKFNFRRLIVAKIFNLIVRLFLHIPFQDTQCGAKIFTRNSIKEIVNNVKMSQWAFDVEVLYVLHKKRYKIAQLPTIWKEVEGGSIKLGKSSLQMLFSIIQLRIVKSPFNKLLKPIKPIRDLIWGMLK